MDRTRLVAEFRARREAAETARGITEEWFPEQRACFDDPAKLIAALCSRRAGKTRAGNKHLLRQAMTTPNGRFLYINSTLGEAKRLAWYGARGDGMAALVDRLKLPARTNETDLTIHFPRIDSWIQLRGVDDEKRLQRALGTPFNEVLWDEAQKIPPKLTPTINDVLMPSLLDYRGRLRLTGTPTRNMRGLFYEVTRPQLDKRREGWSVHHWTLLDNPFFGRAVERHGQWFVIDGTGNRISGPHEPGAVAAAVAGARHQRGLVELQTLLGGAKAFPLDSPTMQREGGGRWVYEDANLVYPVHAVPRPQLCYAPARVRDEDGYPDIARALEDLPGWGYRDYYLALGIDLGYSPDPFAWVLWAWSLADPVLYEVASWKRTLLDSDEQVERIRGIREVVPIGIITADAGGGGKQVVAGWSKRWVARYGIPIIEAEKKNKHAAIEQMASDLRRGWIRVRDGGKWLEEAEQHHWSKAGLVSASGKLLEDPTTENHCCFVAGTLVQLWRGAVPIEEVQVGDRALTRAGWRPVTAAWCTGERVVWELRTSRGVLEGTIDHPVWTARGWRWLSALSTQDVVFALERDPDEAPGLVPVQVLAAASTRRIAPVYNITVEDQHEYLAGPGGGILVSNCDAGLYAAREAYHYRFRDDPPPPPEVGSEAWAAKEEAELAEGAAEHHGEVSW